MSARSPGRAEVRRRAVRSAPMIERGTVDELSRAADGARVLIVAPGASWLGPRTSAGKGLDWSSIAGTMRTSGRLALPHREPYAGGELLLLEGAALLRDERFGDAEIRRLAAILPAQPSLLSALPHDDLPLAYFPDDGAGWISAGSWDWLGLDRGTWWGDTFVHPRAPEAVAHLRSAAAPLVEARLDQPPIAFERVPVEGGELLRPSDPHDARTKLCVWRFASAHGLGPALYEELGSVVDGLDVKDSAARAGRKINAIRMRRRELLSATGTHAVLELAALVRSKQGRR